MQNRLSEQLLLATKMFNQVSVAHITMTNRRIARSTELKKEASPLFVLQELKISSEKKFHQPWPHAMKLVLELEWLLETTRLLLLLLQKNVQSF